MLQYPPISNILEVLVFSEKEEKAAMLAEVLKSKTISYHDMIVLGPNRCTDCKASGCLSQDFIYSFQRLSNALQCERSF